MIGIGNNKCPQNTKIRISSGGGINEPLMTEVVNNAENV
jgi:hypothetical protein